MIQGQLDIFAARKARDKGILQAVTHANQVSESWSTKVYELFKDFLRLQDDAFQFEEFRLSVIGKIPEPPHKRAFGAIAAKAARQGLIERVGYAPVKNVTAHACFASVWRRT